MGLERAYGMFYDVFDGFKVFAAILCMICFEIENRGSNNIYL
jgi:hypothetical protein